ncbi:ABC transporter ATP-binding protein [Devosia sp. LjRoot3]|uniref:ABC transporter ATP-binding protein n=1 Tax=Devosia sp. LjRoot3 TaxID=3342319 RepID=UPI003ECE533E
MSQVQIRGVSVHYGQHEVLQRLDLDIAKSEFIVLLGPSGCGKSTLLNAIAGLQEVSSGTIEIGGHDVTRVEPKDRGIAMVFQSYALYPRMTVRDNLSFGLKVAKVAKTEIERRVGEVARMLQIEALLDRRPAELSGGQRQRVAIGRAVVREAKVFLFDEPLSNLDAQLRADLRVEIKRLHQRLSATMIYVTHDQIEAMTLADRIAVMKDRVIQQLGTPDEIYRKPANTFVARFVGSPAMNLMPAMARAEAGGLSVEIDGKSFPVDADAKATHDQALTVGIRPEHLRVDVADNGGINGVIDVIEPMGPEKLVWIKLGDQVLCAKLDASFGQKAGDQVWLSAQSENIHVFDKQSGVRL